MRQGFIALFILWGVYVQAQDIHLSQFNNSPLNLDPAMTGLFTGDYRFIANQRNQWSSVPVPYATYCIGADMRKPIRKFAGDNLGLGLQINSDKAGDTHYKTLQATLNVSYIKKISTDSTMFLSGGLGIGITNKAFVPGLATYDNQYDGISYNPGLPSNENYTNSAQITYPDLTTGLNWLWKIKERTAFNLGFAYAHINKPAQSFFGKGVPLDPRLTVHTSFSYKLNMNIDVIPSVLYNKQGKYDEVLFGGTARYLLQPEEGKSTAFNLGFFYRLADAPVAFAGFDISGFNFGISYDVNTSGLIAATNNRGGYELSLIYIIQKFVPKRSNKSFCPIYL